MFTFRKLLAENCKSIIVQLCFKCVYKIPMSVLGLRYAQKRVHQLKQLWHFSFLILIFCICILYLLHLYPGFYSYTEGATWKIRNLLTETLLIQPSIKVSRAFGWVDRRRLHRQMPLAHFSRIGGYGHQTPDLLHGKPEYVPLHSRKRWFPVKNVSYSSSPLPSSVVTRRSPILDCHHGFQFCIQNWLPKRCDTNVAASCSLITSLFPS